MAIVEYGTRISRQTHERTVCVLVNGRLFCALQASPYDIRELAVGVLKSEGVIDELRQISDISYDDTACTVSVKVLGADEADAGTHARGSSGGNVPALVDTPELDRSTLFNPDCLLEQMDILCSQSPHRNAGECVHGCGVGQANVRNLLFTCEDIGRHNAMDKAIGRIILEGLTTDGKAMLITGRISAEMAMKACYAGFPVLVSRKSATDDAVVRAGMLGITLVSHCRDGRMRVLSHPFRIA